MDSYLLRDSHHTGVAYGKFDHYRLIDELRILPTFESSTEAALGIKHGGIYSAEALAIARYFMFSQVYYHPLRLIYDEHLKDFLAAWLSRDSLLKEGTFPIDLESYLRMADDEIISGMRVAALDSSQAGHDAARCIMTHSHFKVLYERNPQDAKVNSDPGLAIARAAEREFSKDAIRYSKPKLKDIATDFPVRARDGRIEPAISLSEALSKLQPTSIEYVFIRPDLEDRGRAWLDGNRNKILASAQIQEDEDHETQSKSSSADAIES
jgi:HD superfamily phosphohydrolase